MRTPRLLAPPALALALAVLAACGPAAPATVAVDMTAPTTRECIDAVLAKTSTRCVVPAGADYTGGVVTPSPTEGVALITEAGGQTREWPSKDTVTRADDLATCTDYMLMVTASACIVTAGPDSGTLVEPSGVDQQVGGPAGVTTTPGTPFGTFDECVELLLGTAADLCAVVGRPGGLLTYTAAGVVPRRST